jgi:Tfp pilus assembly protein PilF
MCQTVGGAIAVPLRFLVFQFACALLLAGLAFSQGSGGIDAMGTGGRHSIQGRIYYPSGQRADTQTKVRLESIQYGERTVLADLNGTFSFKSLAPGSYTVVIDGGSEYESSRENVLIDTDASSPRTGVQLPSIPRSYQVQVFLQPKRGVATKPGVVDAELAAVAEPARSYYEKGLAFASTGETEKAIEQLKQAVAHYPEFVLALNELGVQYLKAASVDKAAEVLERAIRLKPDAFAPRLNYGIALLQKRKYAEAEKHLRQAVSSNNDFATAHLYLGMTLIHLSKYDEAETELVKAIELAGSSPHMAQAHYYLGGIYWRKKQYDLAADQLETYLKQSPNASDAEKIKTTIVTLRQKT